jgi:hypothetical protein
VVLSYYSEIGGGAGGGGTEGAVPEAGGAKEHANYKITFHSSNHTLFM